MSLGLALGSGGARGWCHIGVLRELKSQGMEPDVVAGCSMGALVGAVWAAGKLDALEDWARSLTKARFLRYLDLRLDRGGLVEGSAITQVLSEIGLPDRIEDLDRPFLAVATDMATGREIWLKQGPLIPAIRASIAIPGVFSPCQHDGRWLLDGGLINPVPTSACRALGAARTIAVNPNAKSGNTLWEPKEEDSYLSRIGGEGLRGYLPQGVADWLSEPKQESGPAYMDVVSTSIDILTEFLRASRAAVDPADVVLDADLSSVSVMELFRAEEAIAEGQRIASSASDALKTLGAEMGKRP
ncbi:patatin-like phospholipase family protein [Thalassococcus lentus]|uniref:Patatin-like phospholipase family protein n=1 Tax=Thalassococcus lentus TaxID=1210524 RepID=A0ABT4XRP1_9RHOB|nr:patatin-like phospholipase family protein [Thalassococcus lentus]MDA7424613.1 patatin-like phospholipase family protein [Thalassococcus lentus]